MQNTILHLDLDSFFASVEQQVNPKLVGKPVGVIKGPGRTWIIAASKEAKKLGIKTGTTVWEAKKIYPKIALLPADFDKYFSVTKKFIEICSRYSPDLEVFSIDELFLDITKTKDLFGGTFKVCQNIKENIKNEIGEFITCSIGISYNRLLAKLASGIKKPDGIFEITPQNRDEILFKTKLSDICGIGERIEKRLFNMGINNFKNLRKIPFDYLEASFGHFLAVELKELSFGEDDSILTRIDQIPKMQSISRTYTLYEDTIDMYKIKATLRNLCEGVGFKAREMAMKGKRVGVEVRGSNLEDCRHKTLKYFIDSGKEIFGVVLGLFYQMKEFKPIRFLGVWLGDLKPKQELTLNLFSEEQKEEKLNMAMDKINKKLGGLTLFPAIMLGNSLIKSEVNGFLGDKGFRVNELNIS